MDYLDKNNIYKPETITLKFEDYQKLLDRIHYEETFHEQLLEMVNEKKLVHLMSTHERNKVEMFAPIEKIVRFNEYWKLI